MPKDPTRARLSEEKGNRNVKSKTFDEPRDHDKGLKKGKADFRVPAHELDEGDVRNTTIDESSDDDQKKVKLRGPPRKSGKRDMRNFTLDVSSDDDDHNKMRDGGSQSQEEDGRNVTFDDSGDEGSENGGRAEEEEIEEAIEAAVGAIASLPNPEDVQDALVGVKKKIKTLLYTSQVADIFKGVIQGDNEDVFSTNEPEGLVNLFHRCMVSEHSVYKDDEWTLGARRDYCGACTSLVFDTEEGDLQLTMTWYWRSDEETGFVEEFSLVRDANWDDSEDEDEDGIPEHSKGGGSSLSASKTRASTVQDFAEPVDGVTIVEGIRTNVGVARADVNLPGLRALEDSLKSGLSLQTLLRFLLLCSRTECPKTQGKLSSVTQGFDQEEDLEEIRKYLSSFVVPCSASAEGSGKQGKRGISPSSARDGNMKRQKRSSL